MKINLNSFTNQELVNAIVKYLRSNYWYNPNDASYDLESGKWLEWYEEQLNNENG
jgi:hypothetical protein